MLSREVSAGDVIAVWFSCGAASAVAAKMTIEKYGDICDIRILNNPVVEEHEDNRRFLQDCQNWLRKEIELVVNPKYPHCSAELVWEKQRYMAGVGGARCTKELKREARYLWEENNRADWIVMGFTSEERSRHDGFVLTERKTLLPILIEANLTKQDCFDVVTRAGIALPEIYKLGYPNANCIGCVKARSPTYWNHVRKTHPEIFEKRAILSREIGARLVKLKGEHTFLDELPVDAKGRPMKQLRMPDCGIFCEERPFENLQPDDNNDKEL